MDECEVTNLNYREYIYWMRAIYQENYPNMVKQQCPTKTYGVRVEYNENLKTIISPHAVLTTTL